MVGGCGFRVFFSFLSVFGGVFGFLYCVVWCCFGIVWLLCGLNEIWCVVCELGLGGVSADGGVRVPPDPPFLGFDPVAGDKRF